MRTFIGDNPSSLQLEILNEIMESGDEVSPRGKRVKEVRPASVEFLNPLRRVTFVRGRRINPFFQLAESLWILSGRSDVAFLDLFNKNMISFSDDGKYFNASYGERMRTYGKNDLHGVVYNPVDQLTDVFIKLTADKDSRQAVIVLSNPHFDNAKYTIGERGKDIACNLILTFKIRNNKLHLTVFNRSNDVIWGLFGANLSQFTTIQEILASWLGVEVGTYHQVTDSLHLYLDDYASKGNAPIFNAHPGLEEGKYYPWENECLENTWWEFDTEPRMKTSKELTEVFFEFFWRQVYPKLADDEFLKENWEEMLVLINSDPDITTFIDEYWKMAIGGMVAYRFIRFKDYLTALKILDKYVPNSSWKVSMLYFIRSLIEKTEDEALEDAYNSVSYKTVASCKNEDPEDVRKLKDYLVTRELRQYR